MGEPLRGGPPHRRGEASMFFLQRTRAASDLAAQLGVDGAPPAAADQEMKDDDRPEQGIFDATIFPSEAELPVIADDRDDQEDDDRHRDHPREQPDGEADA